MAFNSTGFEMWFTFKDANGRSTTRSYKAQDAVYADVITAMGVVRSALQAVCDVPITDCGVRETYVNDAFAYVEDTEVTQIAVMTLRANNNPNKHLSTTIPAPKIGIFEGVTGESRMVVDADDAAVITFWGLFTPDGEIFLSDGEEVDEVDGFVKGRRSTRKMRLISLTE